MHWDFNFVSASHFRDLCGEQFEHHKEIGAYCKEKIGKEIKESCILGPFTAPVLRLKRLCITVNLLLHPCITTMVRGVVLTTTPADYNSSHIVSFPIGDCAQKAPGGCYLIYDLSYPEGRLMNDCIPNALCSVQYTFLIRQSK